MSGALKQMHVDLTGTVKQIVDTGRVFATGGGGIQKKKYIIKFTDDYEAEYCLPLLQQPHFTEGEVVTFRINDRGRFGDVIQIHNTPGYQPPPGASSPEFEQQELQRQHQAKLATTNLSMVGHPASIALQVAGALGAKHGWTMEQVFDYADQGLAWLLQRREY